MKLAAVITIAAIAVASAQGKTDSTRQVTVWVQDKADVPSFLKTEAERQAAHMFASIGVKILWKDGTPSARETDAIAIELATNTARATVPGALAYALPYEGVHIRIFWDRIEGNTATPDPTAFAVLAHVMVHEITHILQGVARHSEEGIMKAQWTADDRAAMRWRPLAFTSKDIDLIHLGMDARAAHSAKASALAGTAAAVETAAE